MSTSFRKEFWEAWAELYARDKLKLFSFLLLHLWVLLLQQKSLHPRYELQFSCYFLFLCMGFKERHRNPWLLMGLWWICRVIWDQLFFWFSFHQSCISQFHQFFRWTCQDLFQWFLPCIPHHERREWLRGHWFLFRFRLFYHISLKPCIKGYSSSSFHSTSCQVVLLVSIFQYFLVQLVDLDVEAYYPLVNRH